MDLFLKKEFMTDYVLTAGRGTTVREDTEALTAHVDMNVVNLDDISGSPSNTDMVAIQKAGATAPVKTSLLSLKSVLGDGRARNIKFMTASGAIDHTSGTDTLIIASITTTGDAAMQLPTTATAGDRIELYSTSTKGATNWSAYFTCSSALIWPVAFVDPDDPAVLVSSWGAGIYPPGYLFAIWDGTYWRVGYLRLQY
jgi:hypothetical protein